MGGNSSKCIGERDNEVTNHHNGINSFSDKIFSTPVTNSNTLISMGPGNSGNHSLISKESSPMPDTVELERRFTKVLVSINQIDNNY